ncbi:MAG: hypothetical protein U0452_15900 [Anaerolineae bacterium]
MTMKDFLQAAPKAELGVRLEGAMNPATLQVIANQNDIPLTTKHFRELMAQIQKPDLKRADELARVASTWINTPLELARVAYDAATALWKSGVHYAEITVSPGLYEGMGLRLDDLFAALNDGRDRAQRAWGIRVQWLLAVPRDEPRRADDVARYAASVTGGRAGVAGLALLGNEELQPAGQFERAFKSAEKHEVPRVVQTNGHNGAEGLLSTLDTLRPNRLIDAWDAWTSPDLLDRFAEEGVGVLAGISRGLKNGRLAQASAYPLRTLLDAGVPVTLSVDAPSHLGATLSDAYFAVLEDGGVSVEDVTVLLLNGVRMSFLDESEKVALEAQFVTALEAAKALL